MNKEFLIQQIKIKADTDSKKRQDPRFLETMGFLTAKGFLKTNYRVLARPNKRLRIDDAIWAGINVEPRILEVLPAAVLRLEKHFDLDRTKHPELAQVVDQLRRREENGQNFFGIPFNKIKVWADYVLRDKRVKPVKEKKIVKNFRLDPKVIEHLEKMAIQNSCTETDIIEALLLDAADNKK